MVIVKTDADFDKSKCKLKGKFVLTMELKAIAMITEPQARRWTDAELLARSNNVDGARANTFGPATAGPVAPQPTPEQRAAATKFAQKVHHFFKNEGALVVLSSGYNGDGIDVFATGGGSRDPKDPDPSATGRPHPGTLQSHRPSGRPQDSGEAPVRHSSRVPGRARRVLQCDRRDP